MSVRKSASLIIFNPSTYTILFMQRPLKGTFASAYVFPGGACEPTDVSPEFTALRETFEETGLLIHPDLDIPVCRAATVSYSEALQENRINAASSDYTSSLVHLSSWTTPPPQGKTTASMGITKRFETDFYLYKAPISADLSSLFPSLVPPSSETYALKWMTASDALAQFTSNKIKLMPPQWYILNSIMDSCKTSSDGNLSEAIHSLSNRVFKPRIVRKTQEGKVIMDWGQDEYGLLSFSDKDKTITGIQLLKGLPSHL